MLGMKNPIAVDPIKVEHDVKLPIISINTEKIEELVIKAGKGVLALYAGKKIIDVVAVIAIRKVGS